MPSELLRRPLALGSATALTVLLLAGCAEGADAPAPGPASSSATPPAPEVEVGTSITATDAKELNDAAGQYRAYEMPDGTFLVIDSEAPLPDPVKASVSAEAESNVNVFDGGLVLPKPNSAVQLANATSKETGRKVYVIAHAIPDFAGIDWVGYAYYLQPWADTTYHSTLAEAEAAAIADAASQGIPASMVDTIVADY